MSSIKFWLLLLPFIVLAQQKELKGKVLASDAPLHDVYVINATSGEETKTVYGNFSISAQPGDKLVVYSPKINTRKFILHEDAFSDTPYIITVNVMPQELEEVIIDEYQGVDEVSLGLVPADQKKYTYTERQLKAARQFKVEPPYLGTLILPIDPLVNLINGRTKKLKKQLRVEGKEQLIITLEDLYPTEKLVNELYIPKEYVAGFYHYVAENNSMAQAVAAKNDDMIGLLMTELAEEYLKLQKDDE
ncbi:hypothetical protein GCM10007424_22850 [Flavobacterium suaedae]|uniref:Carboxypeptidase-like regulatory domain-containing protein n=1 Tax=Flavobacterium suaedae TaxID=1767027 RepID=A0ABQ1JYD6_9FLAO|nr:hypothetical protein [Flavobacterium suaedae]GGB82258.1 hypothetical protein GCM10007424_22850 [Flavobacterium suaedae]